MDGWMDAGEQPAGQADGWMNVWDEWPFKWIDG